MGVLLRCSLCPTVSKDLMRDLEVAAGSGSTSSMAFVDKAGLMLHQSDGLTSSPCDLTDTVNKIVVYRYGASSHVGIYFYRLPENIMQSRAEIIMNLGHQTAKRSFGFKIITEEGKAGKEFLS